MDVTAAKNLSGTAYWTQAMESRLTRLSETRNINLDTFDEETRAIQDMLIRFRSRWIMLSPVSKLPAEILSLIFEMLANISLKWQNVTRVCHSWRSIAISDTALWSNFRVTTEKRWNLFIERARGRPLSVYIQGWRPQFTWLASALRWKFHHIETLRIESNHDTPPSYLDELSVNLNQISLAPHLRHLIIDLDNTKLSSISLSKRFITSVATSLRLAVFGRSSFPWGATSSTLTRLSVIKATAKSVNAICEGLQGLPSLEYLALNIREFKKSEPLSSVPASVMQHLREVHLGGTIETCTELVPCLRLVPTAHLDISVTDEVDTIYSYEIDDLITSLKASEYHRVAESDYTTVKTSITSQAFDIQLLTQNGLYPAKAHPPPGLHVRIEAKSPTLRTFYPDPDDLFDEFCAGLDKTQWRAVEFLGEWKLQWYTYSAVLSATGIEMFTFKDISRSAVEYVLTELDPSLRGISSPDTRPALLFPVLHNLSLESISFGCFADACDGEGALAYTLCSTLQARREAGHPILSLELRRCSIANGYAEMYHSEVEHFSWDGDVGDAHECHSVITSEEEESESDSESEGEHEREREHVGEDEDEDENKSEWSG
ncbi:hypothetical protein PENSPDRAFT_749073 [Peniophora sp. CONT]|nr:hypothetical protein PENSPDRAFT_749073 [Peniophora sp. CONT]